MNIGLLRSQTCQASLQLPSSAYYPIQLLSHPGDSRAQFVTLLDWAGLSTLQIGKGIRALGKGGGGALAGQTLQGQSVALEGGPLAAWGDRRRAAGREPLQQQQRLDFMSKHLLDAGPAGSLRRFEKQPIHQGQTSDQLS